MKLRCLPEDFIVTEITNREPVDGVYSFYELQKQSIGTLEAMQIVQRSWNLDGRQMSHGGLKDRHAVTSQFLTIRNGPEADFTHDTFELEYLGTSDAAYDAKGIKANHFDIVMRNLQVDQCDRFQQRARQVANHGYLNYFDEQRFGSLGASKTFIAQHWCLKNYERALWLALAEHNHHDSPTDRQQKQILRDLWGQWTDCKAQLERSHRRSVVTYLCDHPENFRKAFALVNANLRGLYLSAFQSAVWNRMLNQLVESLQSSSTTIDRMSVGDATLSLLPENVDRASLPAELPLPSVRSKNLTTDMRSLCEQALAFYGMTLREMKVHFPRDRWFSRALRNTLIVPEDLAATVANDELHPQRYKLTLTFQLPRGCYATMLIKSVMDGECDADMVGEGDNTCAEGAS